MKLTNQVRPISYLKAHAPEIIDDLEAGGAPLVITRNGEAKAVLMDIASYEKTQEALALLKILALSQKDVEAGRVRPLDQAVASIRRRIGRKSAA
jgi:prevent-host-death family protein